MGTLSPARLLQPSRKGYPRPAGRQHLVRDGGAVENDERPSERRDVHVRARAALGRKDPEGSPIPLVRPVVIGEVDENGDRAAYLPSRLPDGDARCIITMPAV